MANFRRMDQEITEEDFEVEITDLKPSDDRITNTFWSSPVNRFLHWQHSLDRRQLRRVSAIVIPVLLLLLILFSLPGLPGDLPFLASLQGSLHAPEQSSQLDGKVIPFPETRSFIRILPQQDGFTCILDGMWAQDSREVAFLGYQRSCPDGNHGYEPGLVAVHDGRSGALLAQLQPDKAILQAFHTHFPQESGTPVIYYQHILWSPDGQRLALTFLAGVSSSGPATKTVFKGVLLTDEEGKHMQALLQPLLGSGSYTEWDLVRGETIATPSLPSLSSSFALTIQPALAYHWGVDGSLIAEGRFTDSKVPPDLPVSPVGNPDGGTSFTLWQPGWLVLQTQPGGSPPHTTGVYTWNTAFAAWSPDGRYIVDTVITGGRLALPGQPPPSQQTLVALHMKQIPLLPIHDAGLLRILKRLSTPESSSASGESSRIMVSWSPSGYLVIAYGPGSDTPGRRAHLYRSATGDIIASLFLPGASADSSIFSPGLRWSPDGSHLFLLDPPSGSIIIWNECQNSSGPRELWFPCDNQLTGSAP